MTWKYETDSEGDFVYYDSSKSEKALDDESFTIYLPRRTEETRGGHQSNRQLAESFRNQAMKCNNTCYMQP